MPDSDDSHWWRDRASCATAPFEMVDAAYAKPGAPTADEFKQAYCASCPVAEHCLREAMMAATQCEDWCPCRCGQQGCGCHEGKPR